MTSNTRDRSPQYFSRIIGIVYLSAMALSMFTQVYIPAQILVPGNTVATADNLIASAGLYRTGIVVDIAIFASDVVIAWAFYELLKPVDSALARLGTLLRCADASVLVTATFFGLLSLRLVSGADYLQALDPKHLQGLARLFMAMRGLGLYVGFTFLGAGSAIFAFVLLKSRYVPRLLAAWGMVASSLLAVGSLGTLASPWFAANASMASMAPMFFYEVPLGIWLLIKGVTVPGLEPRRT